MNKQEIIDEVIHTAEQAAISTVMTVMGHGDYFHRVVDHVNRIEAEIPDPKSGKEKRAKFFKEFWVVLNDVLEMIVIPFSESVIRMLLEMALAYVSGGKLSAASIQA